jgi:hypothetical protein
VDYPVEVAVPAKKRLPVDLAAVARAMDDAERSRREHLLDTHTGALLTLPRAALEAAVDGKMDGLSPEARAAVPQAKAVVRANPGHFVPVPYRPPPDLYDVMQRFVASVDDPDLYRNLQRALAGQAPFRRFREVLADDVAEEERWNGYGEAARQVEAREWLESLAIVPLSLDEEAA